MFWIVCGSWLFCMLIQSFDLLSINDVYTIAGPLEKVYFYVGRSGRDALYLKVNGERCELYCDNYRKQDILEDILDRCGVEYDYDPDVVGESVITVIENDAVCEIKGVSTFSNELILGLTFDGVQYCDFDTAYSAWKEHTKGKAAAFPIGIILVLLGNRFFRTMTKR